MCDCEAGAQCAPRSEAVIRVVYCHDHAAWAASVEVLGHTVGGQTIVMSSGTHAFGPFDSYTEAGSWMSSQQRVLKAMIHPDLFQKLAEA